jgi:AraC-like DNA-binding protein
MDTRHHQQDESNELFQEYSRVEQVKKYISENIASDLSASIVSHRFELSVSSLHHLFKNYQGQSYHHYVEDARMKIAFYLITKEGKRIGEAMYATGYKNRSTFRAAFKKKFRQRPGLFRK